MSTTQTVTQTFAPKGLLVRTHGVDESICHTQVQAERRKLLASLRGKQLRIPNLNPMFQHWPSNTNPDVDLMRQDVQQWLGGSATVCIAKEVEYLLTSGLLTVSLPQERCWTDF